MLDFDREIRTELSNSQALVLIAKAQFRPFTESDWDCFMGCETDNPQIAEMGDYCLVLDGDTVNIIQCGDAYGGQMFQLSNMDG